MGTPQWRRPGCSMQARVAAAAAASKGGHERAAASAVAAAVAMVAPAMWRDEGRVVAMAAAKAVPVGGR